MTDKATAKELTHIGEVILELRNHQIKPHQAPEIRAKLETMDPEVDLKVDASPVHRRLRDIAKYEAEAQEKLNAHRQQRPPSPPSFKQNIMQPHEVRWTEHIIAHYQLERSILQPWLEAWDTKRAEKDKDVAERDARRLERLRRRSQQAKG